MLLKAFFIQALWNFERLQNIGFLFCMKPFLDKIYAGEKDKLKEALLRHTGFFNTHPYMANVIIAIAANMENKASKEVFAGADVNAVKSAMSGPLAAIGDSFFWGTLRPVVSFIGIFLVILFSRVLGGASESYGVIIPLAFIFIYNAVHIPVRYWLMFVSFRLDKESIAVISKLEFRFLLEFVRYVGILIVFVSLFFYFQSFGFGVTDVAQFIKNVPDILVLGGALVLSVFSGRYNVAFAFYSVILLCIIISYLGM
jgi:mannose/fructose/N-acetylgalactosamine-specific phosphotransferase system component IID